MTMNRFQSVFICTALLMTTACTFEHQSQLLSPTMPSVNNPVGTGGALMGLWSSDVPLSDPSTWVCGSFQWNVTQQSSNSISGAFGGICAGVVLVEGNGSGQINGNDVTMSVTGQASVSGVTTTCPFTLNGTGRLEGDALHVNYSGSTCLGPVSGSETLRRPNSLFPPSSPNNPSPSNNPFHLGPGPQTRDRAMEILEGVDAEYPHLARAHSTEQQAIAAGEELQLRFIWHLKQAGFNAGRQRNPSGAISNDKMTVFLEGRWKAYDILYDFGVANRPAKVIFLEVTPADHIPHDGISD